MGHGETMIKLHEDISEWNVEEKLYMPDSYGRMGIDVLKKNGIEFTQKPDKSTIGVWKDERGWTTAPEKERSILMCFEGPVRNPEVYKKEFQREFLATMQTVEDIGTSEYFVIPRSFNTIKEFFWKPKEKKLCFIGEDKQPIDDPSDLTYYRRARVGYYTSLLGSDFSLYGRNWEMMVPSWKGELQPKDNGLCGYNIPSPVKPRPVFWDKKFEVLSNHKFTLAIENQSMPGHVTEKVFQAMCCGSIPIYVGHDSNRKIVPADCTIQEWEMEKCDIELKRATILSWLMSQGAMKFSSVTFAEKLCRVIRRIA